MNEANDDIVCIVKAAHPQQAHMWRNALQQEGIRCNVVGDYLDAGIGDIPGMRPELWVHRDDAERATAILDAFRNKDEGTEAGQEQD